MLKLNLLPPEEKNSLKAEEFQRWISFYGLSFLGMLFIFIALLMAGWFFILIQLNSISANLESSKSSFQTQGLKDQESLINNINSQLTAINEVQKKQISFASVINEIAGLIPTGVTLSGLSVNENLQVSLSGFAPQRNQIIRLKESLEKSLYFRNINNPLSNLTKQADIDFSLRFEINPDTLLTNKKNEFGNQ